MRLQGKSARIPGSARGIGMAVVLASEEAGYIVAQTCNVDGGGWMS